MIGKLADDTEIDGNKDRDLDQVGVGWGMANGNLFREV